MTRTRRLSWSRGVSTRIDVSCREILILECIGFPFDLITSLMTCVPHNWILRTFRLSYRYFPQFRTLHNNASMTGQLTQDIARQLTCAYTHYHGNICTWHDHVYVHHLLYSPKSRVINHMKPRGHNLSVVTFDTLCTLRTIQTRAAPCSSFKALEDSRLGGVRTGRAARGPWVGLRPSSILDATGCCGCDCSCCGCSS